ncbi:AzlC family ABC transporter permease [Thalassotalea sp. G20_0]|uniref:AzlC family ABC transporter permease n=1 Tax=Thalassotalea sp. G20_0 TaxID=2821093 RepID=UPI001ADC9D5A|nr:AzlC family ABC transporter permease [Thalassotalea sp. G20_0]MBO9492509.1 AzlC family ABC transporter permease [Thalassotalea sp. G20_0]
MSQAEIVHHSSNDEKVRAFFKGAAAIIPLTVAVLPWGILTGSLAIESGFDPVQSQALSGIIFAGAVQLAIMGMIQAGVGLGSILISALLITSRHFLYSMVMRKNVSPLPLRWRLAFGFLLTDELFAIANPGQLKRFDRWYALGGGLCFYLGWNLATLGGIIAGASFENLDALGLDFAIAATFIALVIPSIKNAPVLVCVLTALVTSAICEVMQIQVGLLISAPLAMVAGFACAKATDRGES